MLVIPLDVTGSGHIRQIAYRYDSDLTYMRRCTSGTWGSWVQIWPVPAPANEIGVWQDFAPSLYGWGMSVGYHADTRGQIRYRYVGPNTVEVSFARVLQLSGSATNRVGFSLPVLARNVREAFAGEGANTVCRVGVYDDTNAWCQWYLYTGANYTIAGYWFIAHGLYEV
jgi:hypothetical protein